MVLEGRMAVGHGGVPGVAGFGEEAEVREAEAAHEREAGLPSEGRSADLGLPVDDHGDEQRREGADQEQAKGGFAHGTDQEGQPFTG